LSRGVVIGVHAAGIRIIHEGPPVHPTGALRMLRA
jgi:hypothetical protein